jgi:hypothetical protein
MSKPDDFVAAFVGRKCYEAATDTWEAALKNKATIRITRDTLEPEAACQFAEYHRAWHAFACNDFLEQLIDKFRLDARDAERLRWAPTEMALELFESLATDGKRHEGGIPQLDMPVARATRSDMTRFIARLEKQRQDDKASFALVAEGGAKLLARLPADTGARVAAECERCAKELAPNNPASRKVVAALKEFRTPSVSPREPDKPSLWMARP